MVLSKTVIFISRSIKVGCGSGPLWWIIYASLELQSFAKYLKQTVVFMWNSVLWKYSISVFQEFFASTEKIFISGGGLALGHSSIMFRDLPEIFSGLSRLTTCEATRICTNVLLIITIRSTVVKGKFAQLSKVSKYFEHDCRLGFSITKLHDVEWVLMP